MSNTESDVLLMDFHPSQEAFLEEVLSGLRLPQKRLRSKYLYDQQGSELFEQICELDEYYLTRTELAIMRRYVGEMADAIGPHCMLIELGTGSGLKTRIVLDHLQSPAAYVPLDISREHLMQTAGDLSTAYPHLEVLPVCADFMEPLDPPDPKQDTARNIVYFPGSTIGNLDPDEAPELLKNIVGLCGPNGGLLLGIDLKKDPAILKAAYNDRDGVTAQFNLNILRHINRELNGNFALPEFEHRAIYNEQANRIEMYLVSLGEQTILLGEEAFTMKKGETIFTEYSHKYDLGEFRQFAASVGLHMQHCWTDDQQLFAVLFLVSQ